MTKQELEEVFYIDKEIKDLERRITAKERQSEGVSDVVQNGYKRHAVIFGIDVKRAYKLQNMHEKLKKFKIQLVDKQQEIINYIQKVPFSEIRQILMFRYIDGHSWIKIAHEMNSTYRTDKYTEDNIRIKIDRFLEKN